MFGLLLVMALGVWVLWRHTTVNETASDLSQRLSSKLDQLWMIAQDALKDRKYLRAEKALLTILRVDEKNATAYNRLGILYAKQQAYNDAIECFEIAQSLEPSASSLHNVGLIYFETERYDKAALAFEQALAIEDSLASRHIAYAKVQEKIGNLKRMIESLERAVQLEPSVQSYHILADAYDRAGEIEKAADLRARIVRAMASKNPPVKRVQQTRRVVM
jgi:tetratricopeptide (TPR) repeat protein